MKKLLAVVLAAATVASLGVTAFAAAPAAPTEIKADDLNGFISNTRIYTAKDLRTDSNTKITTDVVTPDSTYYYWMVDEIDALDEDFFKIKYDKGDENSKMIKSLKVVDKDLDGKGRHQYLEIKTSPDFTDTEFKVDPSVTLSLKQYLVIPDTADASTFYFQKDKPTDNVNYAVPGTKITFDFKFWISNSVDNADKDYTAGTGGVVLKPVKNEDNEILWSDENRDLARLTFVGDSDVNKVFPKLSTKWENSDYAEYFADQDAFLFDFVGNMAGQTKISSTSRATLEIYNPYYDADEDELTVDPEDIIIYAVDVDGTFTDVTASFAHGENEDGDCVFVTKTRELGTYIFAEKVAGATTDDVVEAPETGKEIPNTGR